MTRYWPLLFCLVWPSLADAAGVQVTGRAGYLSEWELQASAQETTHALTRELSGLFTLTHTGLCSVKGPTVKSGEIHIRMSRLSSSVQASLTLDGAQCSFVGSGSDRLEGILDCPDAHGVPLSLSIK